MRIYFTMERLQERVKVIDSTLLNLEQLYTVLSHVRHTRYVVHSVAGSIKNVLLKRKIHILQTQAYHHAKYIQIQVLILYKCRTFGT